jgi:hypothetical protein
MCHPRPGHAGATPAFFQLDWGQGNAGWSLRKSLTTNEPEGKKINKKTVFPL